MSYHNRTIFAESSTDAVDTLYSLLLQEGETVNSDVLLSTKEFRNFTIVHKNPRDRIYVGRYESVDLIRYVDYALNELCKNDEETTKLYKSMHRLSRQVMTLRTWPESKRITVEILNTQYYHSLAAKHFPKIVSLSFFVRDGKLDCTVVMRSQKLQQLAYDLFTLTLLHEYMASLIQRPVGIYSQFNLSLYLNLDSVPWIEPKDRGLKGVTSFSIFENLDLDNLSTMWNVTNRSVRLDEVIVDWIYKHSVHDVSQWLLLLCTKLIKEGSLEVDEKLLEQCRGDYKQFIPFLGECANVKG